jgi:ribosomal protein S18 acetylase RimI-like enzyme
MILKIYLKSLLIFILVASYNNYCFAVDENLKDASNLLDITDVAAETIGKILGNGFVGDPVTEWVLGENNEQGLVAFFSACARVKYIPEGFGHVDPEYRGATLWLKPYIPQSLSLLSTIAVGYSMFSRGLLAGFISIYKGYIYEWGMAKQKPQQPYYYLFSIATIEKARGQKVGRKLMEAGLAEVDKHNMPAYLECGKEKNVGFYKKFGFEVQGEKYRPSPSCPYSWLMLRKAKSEHKTYEL